MTSSKTIYQKAGDFSLYTRYKGRHVDLLITPDKDRFMVTCNDKLFGHIKIGYDRHTWFVAGSNYVDYDLVKEIGALIKEKFYM